MRGKEKEFGRPQKPKGASAAMLGYTVVESQEGEDIKAAASEIQALEGVVTVEQDSLVYALDDAGNIVSPRQLRGSPDDETPQDDRLHRSLAESTPWGITYINVASLWNIAPQMQSPTAVKVCVIDTGIDPNHEDFAGIAITGASYASGSWDVDGHGHGTHCAGTIGAVGGNGSECFRF